MNKKCFLCLLLALYSFSVFAQQKQEKVRFIFATDVHLTVQNSRDRFNGFKQSLSKMKESKADFVIFGGDLFDVSGIPYKVSKHQADSMHCAFKQTVDDTEMRYYVTIGNHDRYYDKDKGYVEGDEMFKEYFKESYYTFEEKGVRFFVLNSVQDGKDGFYVGEKQLEWLKTELSNIPASTPIVVSTHVPVYSLYYPVVDGKYVFVDVIMNYKELLKVFENHNLKLVLQGHQHIYEEIFVQNVRYITAGAVSAAWWKGPFHGTEQGFLIVEADKSGDFTWEYVDFGWIAKE
ncbi:MAG: metallophosphoesterase [Prevotellaceae bacterium]|jgi:DNA repair exonuclease SbcCD nuclease subunit|nr:metallophosphoesterase [Prevotellaceae bacterium]